MQQLVLDLTEHLDARTQQEVARRAEALQVDENRTRQHAECVSLLEAVRVHPEALTGVTAVAIERGSRTEWLLCTDLTKARALIRSAAAREVGTRGLAGKLGGLLADAKFLAPL